MVSKDSEFWPEYCTTAKRNPICYIPMEDDEKMCLGPIHSFNERKEMNELVFDLVEILNATMSNNLKNDTQCPHLYEEIEGSCIAYYPQIKVILIQNLFFLVGKIV